MTKFFKRENMDVTEWGPLQIGIEALQMTSGAPHDLMMFATDRNGTSQDIYLGMPDHLADALDQFTEIERADLPDYLTTLVVREDEFQERFPDIAAKRRMRKR